MARREALRSVHNDTGSGGHGAGGERRTKLEAMGAVRMGIGDIKGEKRERVFAVAAAAKENNVSSATVLAGSDVRSRRQNYWQHTPSPGGGGVPMSAASSAMSNSPIYVDAGMSAEDATEDAGVSSRHRVRRTSLSSPTHADGDRRSASGGDNTPHAASHVVLG